MENLLSVSYSILFGSLRPWTPANQGEEKFRHVLNHNLRTSKDNAPDFFRHAKTAFNKLQIQTEAEILSEFDLLSKAVTGPDFENEFQLISLPVFFNKQTEFYSLLLKNELTGTLAVVFEALKHADEIETKCTLYHLFDKINEILNKTAGLSYEGKANLFIINTLKLCLLNLHTELVRHYREYLDFDVLSEGEVLYLIEPDFEYKKAETFSIAFLIEQFLTESKARVKAAETEKIVPSGKKEAVIIDGPVFIPRQTDFRGSGISPVSFTDLRNVELFSKFEKEIFDSKLINEDYEFQKKRGNKEMLAALYKILVQKNYFHKTNRKKGKEFEPCHYRQYLDYRYNTDTSQQFRKCTPDDIQQFKNHHSWIDNIAFCR